MKSLSYLVITAVFSGFVLLSCDNNENDVSKKEFTVSFDTGEGGSYIASAIVIEGEKAVKPAQDPSLIDHNFAGWYKELALVNQWDFDTDVVTSDMTLYAKWISKILDIPANLSISVNTRLMTVTWDAVENASGYRIYTTSVGCPSGNRIVDTVTKTATDHNGTPTNSDTAAEGITDRGNGFVTFTGETSFTIWLMAVSGSQTEPMPSSLTARVMALFDGTDFTNSVFSEIVTIHKIDYE